MAPIETLLAIEEIKMLKARYCRLLDTKDWDSWRALFADDFVSDTSGSGGKRIEGADAFVAYVRKALGKPSRTTVHMVHTPEISVTSSSTASGIWMLEDFVRFAPGLKLRAYGHYAETYSMVDEYWRLQSSTLTRVREDCMLPLVSFQVTDRMKRVIARLAPGTAK